MAKLQIALAGTVLKEFELVKSRTSMGRRPHNDIVLDNLAISGDHAVLTLENGHYVLEDLGSTNGTQLNGQSIKRAVIQDGDVFMLGKYRLTLQGQPPASLLAAQEEHAQQAAKGVEDDQEPPPKAATKSAQQPTAAPTPQPVSRVGVLNVISGKLAGKRMRLDKAQTTLGRAGMQVIAITRSAQGYTVRMTEGSGEILINDRPVGPAASVLQEGDVLQILGARIRFEWE